MLKANHAISILRSEQAQNAELIGQYEDALGTATEQIRTYCTDHTTNTLLAQRRHYNALLQAEKDEHFQSRLDRDRWHAQTLRVCAMLRTAHRLRVDEDADQVNVVMALQNQVRVLRRALDLEVESPEAEAGWSVLRHCQDENDNDNDDDDSGGRLNEDDEEAARISTSADENFTASAPAPVPASVLPTRLRHTASTRNLNHNLVPSTTSRTTTASSTDTTTDTSPSEDDDSFDFSVAPTSSVSSNLSSASVSMLSSLSPSVLLPKQSSQQQQQQHNQQPHTQGG